MLKKLLLSFIFICISCYSFAQTFESGFSQLMLVSGIPNPTIMDFAPDGRIFVGQQDGALRVIKNGKLLTTPALKLNVDSTGERGLTGITLHPDFVNNNYVYLYFTLNDTVKRNRISRFTFTGDVINPSSEVIILTLDPLLIAPIHNSGCMKFGQDGKLYVTIGDNNQSDMAQNPDTYWGKMIRINPDGSVPSDNPFASATSPAKKRLWAMGMRNPFTFDIQPGTGRIFINEVGHALWEEIQDATKPGLNFGWPYEQGYNAGSIYTNPFYTYAHGDGGTQYGCAISGGNFFNPAFTNYPSQYIGKYFFIDYCKGWIGYINPAAANASHTVFASGIPAVSITLRTGLDGNIYYLGRDKGAVYKIIYNSNPVPVITNQPVPLTVALTQTATFSVSLSGTPPFTFTWMKNGTAISTTNSPTYSINNVQLSDSGDYSVSIVNASGSTASNVVKLKVSSDHPPVPSIVQPAAGLTYKAGNVILFSGTANDAEEGTLPASAFTWKIEFHHGLGSNEHVHDGPPIATGVYSGSYEIPVSNETSSDVYYRLILSVMDNQGFQTSTYRDILPDKSVITLATIPPNLRVLLDGMPRQTPLSETSVEGIQRNLGVITPQTVNGFPYVFDKWSQGGTASQTISTPVNDVTYTAMFMKDTALRIPENPVSFNSGLDYKYYEGLWYIVPAFPTLTTVKSGTVNFFDIAPKNRADDFAFNFSGYIDIPADGIYTFYVNSNDGSRLNIGNRLIVNNDGEHNTKEVSGSIGLKAGKHAISVGFFEHVGAEILTVSYSGPNISKQVIPAARLFRSVGNVNNNPQVSITSPVNNQIFSAAPAAISIAVNATDQDGTIARVEFYNDLVKIGESLTSPYSFNWLNVNAGTYKISAKATDNQGAITTSSVVTITVGNSAVNNCTADGTITREYWTNISGSAVSAIPLSSPPTGTNTLTIFEAPTNFADNYGTRIKGYICAPQTGNYFFWIASNDAGELWLSTDENPAGKVKIAFISSYTNSREWTKMASQKSAAIPLEAGKKYYIEALQKEGTNSDHLSVGWQLPDGVLERPIGGNRLSPFGSSSPGNNPPAVNLTSPLSGQQYDDQSHVMITANAQDNDGTISKVEFYQNNIKSGEDFSLPYEFMWDHPAIGNYTLTAKAYDNMNAVSTSLPVNIVVKSSVTGGCVAEGKILREYWNGISGTNISSIPVFTPPSGSAFLTSFDAAQNTGDNYGSRISGYVCAPVTGTYYFWIASNDAGELWLSTNDNPANKVKIAAVTTYSNYQEWGKSTSQKSVGIFLTQGNQYYIEALQKEGVNSDHLSVGWQLPDGTLERPIPAGRLSPPSSALLKIATSEELILQPENTNDTTYSISAYPNPTEKGMITLSITGYSGRTKAKIEIRDLEGNLKHTDKISCDVTCPRTLINIDQKFQSGVYVIHVIIDGKIFNQRLIVN